MCLFFADALDGAGEVCAGGEEGGEEAGGGRRTPFWLRDAQRSETGRRVVYGSGPAELERGVRVPRGAGKGKGKGKEIANSGGGKLLCGLPMGCGPENIDGHHHVGESGSTASRLAPARASEGCRWMRSCPQWRRRQVALRTTANDNDDDSQGNNNNTTNMMGLLAPLLKRRTISAHARSHMFDARKLFDFESFSLHCASYPHYRRTHAVVVIPLFAPGAKNTRPAWYHGLHPFPLKKINAAASVDAGRLPPLPPDAAIDAMVSLPIHPSTHPTAKKMLRPSRHVIPYLSTSSSILGNSSCT